MTAHHRELRFTDYAHILAKNKWMLLACLASFLGPTFWFVRHIPDTFISRSQLVMDEDKDQNLMLAAPAGTPHDLGYYKAMFQSTDFLNGVAHALDGPMRRAGVEKPGANYVQAHVSLDEGAIESFVSVESKTPAAPLSYAMTHVATDSLIVFCARVENQETEKAIEAIKDQIGICLRKREEIDSEKTALTESNQLGSMGDYEGLNALEKSYQDELVKFELDKANLEAKRNYFLSLDKAMHQGETPKHDAALEALRARLRDLEKEKDKMDRLGIALAPESQLAQELQDVEEQIMQHSHREEPQDIGLLRQWQSVHNEVEQMESDMQLKKARLDAFRNAIETYHAEHPDLGKREFRLQQLDNLLDRYTETHKRLTERLEDAVIKLQSKSGGLKLVDSAEVPLGPQPRRDFAYYLVSLAVAAMLGVGLSFLREFMDDTVNSTDDVEKQLALTLLGTIPHIQTKKSDLSVRRTVDKGRRSVLNNRYPQLVLGAGQEESLVAEAYRTLRTNIVFASPDKPVQTLLVTSSGPGEGKSLTLANIALSFAQQGEPTLIVDTDLRRPVIHHLFGMERSPGFGEIFAGTLTLSEAVRPVPGTQLHILKAGAYMPNPAELLGSKKMNALIAELKETYRYILFDTPPVIAVTDACILANKLDGVVLMARAGKTNLGVAERALQSLHTVNARVLGCVLNDVDITKGYNSYGYYKHYYHYYLTKKD